MITKNILVKSLKLQKAFDNYSKSDNQKTEVFNKFQSVWGPHMAWHFLSNYEDAESLIWAFDSANLELFITKF